MPSVKPQENEHLMQEDMVMPPKDWMAHHPSQPNLKSFDQFKKLYTQSIEDPDTFYAEQARKELTWMREFDVVKYPKHGFNASWFLGGQLNACYNCVDRHAFVNGDKPAIIYEADEPNEGHIITYSELLAKVSQLAQVLISLGVKKGDTVAVYLPMIPEAVITILAIVRIGAIHSVVFAGFSSGALRDRINNADSKIVITADESKRGGKIIETKKIVDEALKETPQVTNVVVVKRTGNKHVPFKAPRDVWYHEEMIKYKTYLPCVPVDSEDALFLLYTSGSTGKPKGIQHSTAGYLLNALLATKYTFDVNKNDVFFTAGDIGWITGHTFVIYGPLLNGCTTVVFEGTPAYPDFSRYWQIVEKYKVNQFYVAPTALRLLKKAGDKFIDGVDLSSLRSLGSVGEPIAAEIWEWYDRKIGQGRCTIQDTYWQTETGAHLITPLAGITPTKPGSASLPFFGIDVAILDPTTGEELKGNGVEGVLAIKKPWPSVARTIWNDFSRFNDTYYNPYSGYFFTGDGGARDKDGFYWVLGRVDDVVNVSGHRLSTAEIEAAIIENSIVAENAVVGYNHELTGQAIAAFVALKNKNLSSSQLEEAKKRIILGVRKEIGPFAAPKIIYLVDDLPKTRSGKIMRRILRKILAGEEDQLGDVSTLSNPGIVDHLIEVVKKS